MAAGDLPSRALRAAFAITCVLASGRAGAEAQAIAARRTSEHIELDGRMDDDAWRAAPAFSGFVESFPRPGVPASFRTEVRVVTATYSVSAS